MADRLSQLQDAVNMQAENFCNSIGILTQFSKPSFFAEFEKSGSKSSPSVNGIQNDQQNEDHIQLFSQLIARTAKDIDIIIDSLPSEESTPELQVSKKQENILKKIFILYKKAKINKKLI